MFFRAYEKPFILSLVGLYITPGDHRYRDLVYVGESSESLTETLVWGPGSMFNSHYLEEVAGLFNVPTLPNNGLLLNI